MLYQEFKTRGDAFYTEKVVNLFPYKARHLGFIMQR